MVFAAIALAGSLSFLLIKKPVSHREETKAKEGIMDTLKIFVDRKMLWFIPLILFRGFSGAT